MSAPTSSRPTVVCCSSFQFATDAAILQQLAADFDWVVIDNFELGRAQLDFMPLHMRQQTIYAYETGPHVPEIWAKAAVVGVKMLSDVMKERRVVAVMAGNWDYWQDEAIRLACAELKLPFLTLLREHFLTAEDYEDGFGYTGYRLTPKTDGVAVAGVQTLHTLTKFHIIPPERIRVTGLPRFDLWFGQNPPIHEGAVVLLSYMKGYGAETQFLEMIRVMADAAERYPHIPFVIKSKHEGEFPELERAAAAISSKVKVVLTADLPAIMRKARVIIGYNSLSVFEGLFTSAPILIPQWGGAKRDPRKQAPSPTDMKLRQHMTFCESREEFDRLLDRAIAGDLPVAPVKERRLVFMDYVCFKLNETASARIQAFVKEFVPNWAGP
jgi:hypothetical protein